MDCYLEWHSDFQADATGDLLMVEGDVEVRQKLERRLFTAVQGYVWHPEYGAGLPQKIGSTLGVEQIRSIVASQLGMEASVAPFPPAQLKVEASKNDPSLIGISIQYFDAATGIAVGFTITP
jgi:hypothetical protein